MCIPSFNKPDRKPRAIAWPMMGFHMRALTFLAALTISMTSALAAEEPSGCDKFKWPIERERAALTAPDRARLATGSEQAALPASAITLGLVAPSEAKLPAPPERTPKDGTFAGFTSIKAPKAGLYTISLSAGAWVDVVQDGHALKPVDFSGATDCDGIRKTMKYELSAQSFVLQVSGAKENSVSIAILPAQ
jgi:hypothetical protein